MLKLMSDGFDVFMAIFRRSFRLFALRADDRCKIVAKFIAVLHQLGRQPDAVD